MQAKNPAVTLHIRSYRLITSSIQNYSHLSMSWHNAVVCTSSICNDGYFVAGYFQVRNIS